MAGDPSLFDPFEALKQIRREGVGSTEQKLPQKLPQLPAEEFHEQYHRVEHTSATSATSAGGPSAHGLTHARVKEEERKNNLIISYTYARDGRSRRHAAAHAPEGAAEVAEAAEVLPSASDQKETPKNGSAEVLHDGLRKWRRGLASLSPDRPPCPDYRGDEWARTLARALNFLDTFGVQAEALGWTTTRLFGVHPEAGIVRVDACGGLVLPGGAVRAITATEIRLGHLTHYWKPYRLAGIPIWELGR